MIIRFLFSVFFCLFLSSDCSAVQDSTKDGKYEWYFESGKLSVSGFFKEGKRHKVWEEFDESGSLVRKTKYKSGEIRWIYIYRNGKLAETIDRKGRRHKMKDCGC